MAKKKKVQAPTYQAFKGNEWTDRARQQVGTYGDWINSNWQDYLDADLDKAYERQQGIADKAYSTMWNDMLANQRKQNNQLAAANYNRFGSLNNTSSNYLQDIYNRQQNDLASRVASQQYQMLDNLVNSDYQRRANTFGNIYGMYNNAGQTIYNLDKGITDTANKNAEAQYVAAVQNANRGGGFGDALLGGLSGAATGFLKGGPVGAIAGGLGGATLGGFGYLNSAGQLGNVAGEGLLNYATSNPSSRLFTSPLGVNISLFNNKNNALVP